MHRLAVVRGDSGDAVHGECANRQESHANLHFERDVGNNQDRREQCSCQDADRVTPVQHGKAALRRRTVEFGAFNVGDEVSCAEREPVSEKGDGGQREVANGNSENCECHGSGHSHKGHDGENTRSAQRNQSTRTENPDNCPGREECRKNAHIGDRDAQALLRFWATARPRGIQETSTEEHGEHGDEPYGRGVLLEGIRHLASLLVAGRR